MTAINKPLPEPGDIITEETEYTTINHDAYKVVLLKEDGSRLILSSAAIETHQWSGNRARILALDGIPTVWGYSNLNDGYRIRSGQYLPYLPDPLPDDGILPASQVDPVNPVPYLLEWRPHVARFIHGYQLVQETETFRGLSADTKAEVRRLVHGICGTAWFRLDLWDALKPTYTNWGNYTDWVKVAIDAVCTECDSETAARLIGTNINTSEFASKHNAGQVWTTDRSSKPWIPGVKLHELNPDTATPESISSFFEGLKTRAHRALDYYDEIVSKTLIPHSHD